MEFNNFRLNVALRVLALLANVFALLWAYLRTDWQVTPLVSAAVLVLQSIELVYYLETSNRQFAAVLDAIAARDFSVNYPVDEKGKSFDLLAGASKRIMLTLRQLNSERAAQHQLLEAVLEHVSSALLCIDENDAIIVMNQAAKRWFGVSRSRQPLALGKLNARLPALVREAAPGETQLVKLVLDGQAQPLSMFTTRFELLGRRYSLVSLQNIRDELDARELESWQKLIQVLRHEIMNSVTPMVSLSSVIKQTLVNEQGQLDVSAIGDEQARDLLRSLLAIEARGEGLMRFVRSYDSLANVPKPYFSDVAVEALLQRIELLLKPELEQANITLRIHAEPLNLMLRADIQQVEQVIINLVKNAKEAIGARKDGRILISASLNREHEVTLTVSDNGAGIAANELPNIFVPFYSSKKQGSGIGLSISRQLMLANKGHIAVSSEPGAGTRVLLVFRRAG
ncbi:MAG: PAS domain-containing protein [Pseudomonadales bacterium]|jgi:nitrogen fixation/metabolism regulation signal transduction histidine kinase|nr:PAS domain-containing protein [Pseudomonadales bacterium]